MLLKSTLTNAALAIAVIIAYSCSEQMIPAESKNANANSTASSSTAARAESSNPFNASVGAPIDNTVGERWIDNYVKDYASESKTYNFKAEALNKILSDKKCVGVSLTYALDFQKRLHVLPIGVDGDGKKISTKHVYTQNGDISWKTAQRWIANYTGSVSSHFFGQNTFKRLWANGYFDVVATFAIDDKNNPQLLLATNAPNSNSGKAAAKSSFEDLSSPCPPVCPK